MKSVKFIVIIAVVVFAGLSLSAPSADQDATTPPRVTIPRTPTPPDIVRRIPPEDFHKDSVILLEAFMVEVRLSDLHSLGVPVISQGNDVITAEHIIKLIKTADTAKVTAGAKLSLAQANKARTKTITRKAVYTDPHNSANIEYIDVGTSFIAIAEIRQEKVFAEIEFEYSDMVKTDKNAAATPQIVEMNWSSTICLKPGEPNLVGATQGKDQAAFLLVTASIKK